MSTAAPTFRLRRKGQIIGPFSRAQIRVMARRGGIALTDEMSLNGGQWIPVGSTPLADEIPRQATLTLREPRRPISGNDSSGVMPPGGSSGFPTVRKSDSSVFFSQNAADPVEMAASQDLFQTRATQPPLRPFSRPFSRPNAPPRTAPRSNPLQGGLVEDPLAGWDTGARPAASAMSYRRRPQRRSSGDSAMEVVLVIMAVALLIGVIIIGVFVARSRSQEPVIQRVIVEERQVAPQRAPVAPAEPGRESVTPPSN